MITNDTSSQTVQVPNAVERVVEVQHNADNAEVQSNEQYELTPLIPDEVYARLPALFQDGCNVFSGRERDVFLTSALAVLSGCFLHCVWIIRPKRDACKSVCNDYSGCSER